MLCVHAGAKRADLNEISNILCPPETDTYQPVPHLTVIEMVKKDLSSQGFNVAGEEYAVSQETKGVRYGSRMFGIIKLVHNTMFNIAVGIRNSHDKTLSLGLTVGSSIFVCDNLAFIGDFMKFRKHTSFILQDLPELLAELTGSIPALIEYQDTVFNDLRAVELTKPLANDFVVRAAQEGVITSDKILKVLKEFYEPKHPEFSEPTLWSMTNAFTEVLKGSNVFDLAGRTAKLYKLAELDIPN